MPYIDPRRANSAVKLRLLGEHQIAYTLVGPQEDVGIEVPNLLRSRFVRILSELPKSGMQLLSPNWYQHYHLERDLAQPIRFGVIFEQNFAVQASNHFEEIALLHVVAWFGKDEAAIAALAKVRSPLVVIPIGADIERYLLKGGVDGAHIARAPTEIFSRIEQRVIEKLERSPKQYAERKTQMCAVAEKWRAKVLPGPQLPFYPLCPNEGQIRQMLGQFQPDFWQTDDVNSLDQRPAAQAKAFTAVFETIGAVASNHEGPWKFKGHFPSAILAFPSINPMLRENLLRKIQAADPEMRPAAKEVIAGRLAEQDSTTFQSFLKSSSDDPAKTVAHLGLVELAAYTKFLDDMGYLHGSFHCSPYGATDFPLSISILTPPIKV